MNLAFPPAPAAPPARDRDHRRRQLAFGAWCLVLAAAFFRPLADLARLAVSSDLHSHTLLIPFVSAYLLHTERGRLPARYSSAWVPAALMGLLALSFVASANGLAGFAAALGAEEATALGILALICLAAAGGFACFGAGWMRQAAFPFAFLVFMAPLPDGVAFQLEEWLKMASATTAGWLFDLTGTPALHDGVFFRLPGIVIEVAQECSGIRSSYVLLMTSLVAAYLFLRSPWHRAILVAAVIPLGVARNGFRILVLGMLCVRYGPQMIHTWIHHRGGPVFFVLSLVPLFLLLCGLRWLEGRKARAAASRKPIVQDAGGAAVS